MKFSVRIGLLYLVMGLCALGMTCTGCSSSQAGQSQVAEVARDSLMQFFRQSREMYVVYGTGGGFGPRYAEWLAQYEGRGYLRLIPVADTAIAEAELATKAHFLLGTPTHHCWLQTWREALPLSFEDEHFTFAQRKFDQPDQVMLLSFYPSPANPQVPLGLLTGPSDEALLRWLQAERGQPWENPFWSRWGYQVFDAEQRLLIGMFDPDWQPGGEPHWDFMRQPVPDHETAHLRMYQQQSGRSIAELRGLAQQIERRIEALRQWLGDSLPPLAPVSYHLYPDAERLGLMRNVQQQVYVPPQQLQVHRIFNDHYRDRHLIPHEDLLPFIRQALPPPATPLLSQGLAVYLTPDWQREGYRHWAGRLYATGAHLPLGDLLDPERYPTNSPLVKAALAGALVDFLVETWGKATFLARWPDWQPQAAEITALEKGWQAHLARLAQAHPLQDWSRPLLDEYQGMTLAHEGYSIYNGYGSDSARQSLAQLRELGTNSIALVPYSGSRALHEPEPYEVWQRAGSENDAAVVGSFRHAQALGMQILLKPQIWFRGGWPGGVEMRSEADWAAFHRYYRRWIVHYALLAAVHEMDALCAGVEFARATLTHPEVWRDLIRDLRQLYAGPITYAANWGEEAEKLAFGAELDFIGVNCYYPLSEQDEVSKAELAAGFARVREKLAAIHRQHGRPIVLTEVGFRSVDRAWVNPHEGPDGRSYNPEAQRLSYEVIFEGLAEADWCQGMFWWKWPSYLGYAARNPRSFTPCHRPAMQVLAQWYQD